VGNESNTVRERFGWLHGLLLVSATKVTIILDADRLNQFDVARAHAITAIVQVGQTTSVVSLRRLDRPMAAPVAFELPTSDAQVLVELLAGAV
jgi:hypothetical protein